MTDNRDFSRLATNPTSTDAVNGFNDLASEVDGALSASLTVAITNTNTVTITLTQLKHVTRIVLTEGAPATTGTITVFVNNSNLPLGRFTVINETANSATFYLVGGSSPSGTDLIAAGVGTAGGDAAALIDVLDDDVVSVGGGAGGGGTAASVDSVFGRTGVVEAQSGDYDAAEVRFTDPIGGSPPLDNVYEALFYLLNNMGGGGSSAAFSGAHLGLTADITALDATSGYFIAWDAEEYDTNNRHDTVTNNDRVTFSASDVGKIAVVNVWVRINNHTANQWVALNIQHRNSADTILAQAGNRASVGNSTSLIAVAMQTKALANGDYIRATLQVEADTSIDIVSATGQSNFTVRVISGP